MDKQRDLAKEAISTMEDLYLRFEKEKSFIRLQIEREYEDRLKQEKAKFDQKVKIYGQMNIMSDRTSEYFSDRPLNDADSSVELVKAQVCITQAQAKNSELIREINALNDTIRAKDHEISHLKSILSEKENQ